MGKVTSLDLGRIRKIINTMPRNEIIEMVEELTAEEAEIFLYSWEVWARDNQIQPSGNWLLWIVIAGRGWGKTRTGAEFIRQRVSDGAKKIAIIAPTAADVRDIMVEGVSGILNVFPERLRPIYEPSKRRITFHTGATATTFSADEPDRIRGPEHDTIWMDEISSWRYAQYAFDMAMFGLRIGNPKCIITTTPKPTKLIKELMDREDAKITTGNTYENKDNLSKAFFKYIVSKYEGTRLGQQEIHAKILSDTPGALWNYGILEKYRVSKIPQMRRIVIAIDPAVTSKKTSDETGIIVSGLGENGHGYCLEDISMRDSPNTWAEAAIKKFNEYRADCIVAESNNGGDLIKSLFNTIDATIPIKLIHANRGKYTRAEPISSLAEKGLIHNFGIFGDLEDELTTYVPGNNSPNRLDAYVYSFYELLLGGYKNNIENLEINLNMTSGSTWNF